MKYDWASARTHIEEIMLTERSQEEKGHMLYGPLI